MLGSYHCPIREPATEGIADNQREQIRLEGVDESHKSVACYAEHFCLIQNLNNGGCHCGTVFVTDKSLVIDVIIKERVKGFVFNFNLTSEQGTHKVDAHNRR